MKYALVEMPSLWTLRARLPSGTRQSRRLGQKVWEKIGGVAASSMTWCS